MRARFAFPAQVQAARPAVLPARAFWKVPAIWREGAILLAGLVLFSAALAPCLRESGTPPGWDQAVHLRDSVVFERILRDPSAVTGGALRSILGGSERYPLLTPSGYYPPLVPGVTALLYLVGGRSYETAMVTNLLFLALLIVSVWGLGNRLFGRPAGVLAGLLVLAAPGIRSNAGEYMLDLPLTALVIASVWLLLSTGRFRARGRSLAFGALCGAGMLAKWSFFLFLAAPVMMALVAGLREARDGQSRRARWMNLGWAIGAAAAVMAPYYAPILPILVRKTVVHAGGAADGFGSPFSFASVAFHLEALPRRLMGWPLTLSVLGGLILFPWRRREARGAGIFLALWAVSVYILFTFGVANKQSRYLLPWLPVLVLLGVRGIVELWRGRSGPKKWSAAAGALLLVTLPMAGLGGGWKPESEGNWRIDEIARRLQGDLAPLSGDGRTAWKLGVIPDMRRVNGPTVAYYVARRDLPVTVVQLVNRMKRHVAIEVGLDPFDRRDFYQSFEEYDYLLTKTGDNAVPPWEAVVPAMTRYFESRQAEFTRIGVFEEPDGSTVSLYRRNRG
jgi:hypothetical protein